MASSPRPISSSQGVGTPLHAMEPKVEGIPNPGSPIERSALDCAALCVRQRQWAAALRYYQTALQAAQEASNAAEAVQAWSGLGAVHQKQGKLDVAVQCFQQAIHASLDCNDDVSPVPHWNDLGTTYFMAGNYIHALKSHHSAWQFCSEEDLEGSLFSLSGMAAAYYKLGDHEKCVQSYLQALTLIDRSSHDLEYAYAASLCMGLGKSYFQLGQPSVACEYFERALAVAESSSEPAMLTQACLSLGGCHLSLQQPDCAWACYQRAAGQLRDTGEPGSLCRAYTGLGLCYLAAQDGTSALLLLRKALEVSKAQGSGSAATQGDEQLVALLHATVKQQRQLPDPSADLLVQLWGLLAVLLSVASTTTPTALPSSLVRTTAAMLGDVHSGLPGTVRASLYIEHYCMYTLQQLSALPHLAAAVTAAPTIDAILTCMTVPLEDIQGSALQSLSVATQVLRSLMQSPVPAGCGETVSLLILQSTRFPDLLELLPQTRRSADVEQLRPSLYVLSLLAAVTDHCRTAGLEGLVRHGEAVVLLARVVAKLVRTFLTADSPADCELRVLRYGIKILLDIARPGSPARTVAHQLLDLPRLEACLASSVAGPSSPLHPLALELRKALVEEAENPTSLRVSTGGGNSSRNSEDAPLGDDTITTSCSFTQDSQEQDTTSFESLSSHSSFSSLMSGPNRRIPSTIVIHELPVAFEDSEGNPVVPPGNPTAPDSRESGASAEDSPI
eukprot:GGOE01004179.1.p1 GENE.GGOE01004179.1~~GGOE01004179.1.p1  ORF type:complete len:730 (-),score=192.93 GGOE01004179.1:725-2914(-)